MLGAGEGWAKSILFNARARDAFAGFFARPDTFALGVCNGCQMMSNLRELIPGAEHWPRFVRNRSEQFEARLALVRVEQSPSVLLAGHGRRAAARSPSRTARAAPSSRATRTAPRSRARAWSRRASSTTTAAPTERYPENPNGSPDGITALTTPDGRVTIMMPHPERVFRTVQHSWHPRELGRGRALDALFRNARVWVG